MVIRIDLRFALQNALFGVGRIMTPAEKRWLH